MMPRKVHRISLFFMALATIGLGLVSQVSFAQDPDELLDDSWDGAPLLSLAPRTIFPLYAGLGVQLHASPQLKLGLDFGTTPKPYAQAIASTASSLAHEDKYEPAIAAAFDDNALYRVYLRYALTEESSGFGIELGFAQISSESEERVSKLAKAAGLERDYATVETLIAATGRRPYVHMKTKLLSLDLMATYDYEIKHNLRLTTGGGLGKIIGAEVDLSTDVAQFDSSKTGIALLGLGESELADVIEKYGISPLLSIEIAYQF
jgi:hypothetical protein